MPFAYFAKLNRAQKRIYRASDAVSGIEIPEVAGLHPRVTCVQEALKAGDRRALARASQHLSDALFDALEVPQSKIRVLSKRPSRSWGEIHGLYEPTDDGEAPRITVWMRTAQRQQVVAFKTFLRTLIHEWLHHLDYEHLQLEDSFHTRGFYQRESDLFRQLAPGLAGNGEKRPTVGRRPERTRTRKKPVAATPATRSTGALTQCHLPF